MGGKGFAILLIVVAFLCAPLSVRAETKMEVVPAGGGQIIPKIEKTPNDPILENGGVYPMWGPVCQRYTYHTTYRDEKGRAPEYVKMYFNGNWIDVQKEDPNNNDYKNGVRYVYKYVPNKLGSNFFFFEASNGLGKTREGIIDSPGNGPVLFEGDFKDNEAVLIDGESGEKLWSFPTQDAWISGVAISDDGKYLTVLSAKNLYLFESGSNKPKWTFPTGNDVPTLGDVKGGVDISGSGEKIVASLGNTIWYFDKNSAKPIWQSSTGGGSYGVAISKDGKYLAVATAGSETDENSNSVVLWSAKSNKPLWRYHSSGNFHEVSLSNDGSFISGATGCPDRRGYVFSKDSKEPFIRTEMLTRDSPADEAQISGDGALTAFGLESDRGGIVVYDNKNKKEIWRFEAPNRKSVRALAVTDDGEKIAAATFGGDIFLFSKSSNKSLASWKNNSSMGSVEISDDAHVLAVGGADNKVHLYHPEDTSFHKEISLGEYVGEIDVSANGKYVIAGTSGSVYFFETFSPNEGKVFPCTSVIEPSPLGEMKSAAIDNYNYQSAEKLNFIQKIFALVKTMVGKIIPSKSPAPETGSAPSGKQGTGKCGDGICEPVAGETKQSCSQDCN